MEHEINYKLIAISGRKESGKTVIANVIEKYGYTKVSFATPLKKLIASLLREDINYVNEHKLSGINYQLRPMDIRFLHEETRIPIDTIKKEIGDIVFTNTRDMLQIIGTNLIRKYDNNWHVNKTKDYIDSLGEDAKIVIDDVRFPNELRLIRLYNGECWYVVRPKYDNVSNHPSENSLKWQDFGDNVIINNGTKEELEKKWVDFMEYGYTKSILQRNKLLRQIFFFPNELDRNEKALYQYFSHKDVFTHRIRYKTDNINIKLTDDKENLIINDGIKSEIVTNILEKEDLKQYLT